MNQKPDSDHEETVSTGDAQTLSLLKDVLQKLVSMDDKLSRLIRDSKQKSYQDRPFSKPRGDYDKAKYPRAGKYARKKEDVSSEGKFYHGRPFGKKNAAGKSSPVRGKRPYKKPGH